MRAELNLCAARLERNRAALRDIVEASADAIVILDGSGAVRFVNHAAETMYGLTAADLAGQTPGFAVQPCAVEMNVPLPGGATRTVEGRAIPIEWDGGPASLILLHRLAERQLGHDRMEDCAVLLAANAELDAFTRSVTHDLRAPLRHIKGFTQMIEEEAGADLNPSARTLFGRILGSVDRMQKLIDDLLGFSRLAACPVARQPVDPTLLVREAIEELASESRGRAVEWQVGSLPWLDADPSLLRVALANLLSNALKFTRGRELARIEVFAVAGDRPEPVIAVRDNGAGFAPEDAGRLFGAFQRLHSSAEFEGSGIGLSIVNRIVTRHGGRVWAEGQPGVGATFFFSLGPAEP